MNKRGFETGQSFLSFYRAGCKEVLFSSARKPFFHKLKTLAKTEKQVHKGRVLQGAGVAQW